MQDFKKLLVWKKTHELTLDIYKLSKLFPEDEKFGITSQLRRATASIPANIAEGDIVSIAENSFNISLLHMVR